VFGAGGSITAPTAFRIGTADGSFNYFQGWAAPVAMYARSLDPAAILRRYLIGRGLRSLPPRT
jgi:hypothetical protein